MATNAATNAGNAPDAVPHRHGDSEAYENQYDDMELTPRMLRDEIELQYKKFTRACDQLLLIDDQVKQIEVRYQRAVKNQKQSARYTLRLNLSAMTGMKCMMYEYATKQAAKVEELKKRAEGMTFSDDEEEYTDDEWDMVTDDEDEIDPIEDEEN